MKNKTLYLTVVFGIGFYGYGLLEIIWRGRTHPSMSLAGGIVFCLMSYVGYRLKPLKFMYRCIFGGIIITAIELVFGLIFNILLNANVWDYFKFPLNFAGQICLLYSVLWCFLSAPILILAELIRQKFMFNSVETKQNMSINTA